LLAICCWLWSCTERLRATDCSGPICSLCWLLLLTTLAAACDSLKAQLHAGAVSCRLVRYNRLLCHMTGSLGFMQSDGAPVIMHSSKLDSPALHRRVQGYTTWCVICQPRLLLQQAWKTRAHGCCFERACKSQVQCLVSRPHAAASS
jgi:hypothetical protein